MLAVLGALALGLLPSPASAEFTLGSNRVQFNITVLPISPVFQWSPNLLHNVPNIPTDEKDPKYFNASLPYWKDNNPYYVNFTHIETQTFGQELPSFTVEADATDFYIDGKYDIVSTITDPIAYLAWDLQTSEITRSQAFQTKDESSPFKGRLAVMNNMTVGTNKVSWSFNPAVQGAVGATVEQVIITTWMELKGKKPYWLQDVNTTRIDFVKDGNQNYISCGNVVSNEHADYVEIDSECDIDIPAGTAYVILNGNYFFDAKPVTISGLDGNEFKFTPWGNDTQEQTHNHTMYFKPIDYNSKYTLKVIPEAGGKVQLTNLVVYSQKVPATPWYKKVPWWIVGVAVGGTFLLAIIVGVLWRMCAGRNRRKKRDSVLELARVGTRDAYQPLMNNAAPPGFAPTTEYRDVEATVGSNYAAQTVKSTGPSMPEFQSHATPGSPGILKK